MVERVRRLDSGAVKEVSDANGNATVEAPKEKGKIRRIREYIGGKVAGSDATERMRESWSRIHKVGGFLPVFVEGRLELRTKKQQNCLNEIRDLMKDCKTREEFKKAMFQANIKVFMLFQITGSPYQRGGKDKTDRFSSKVMAYTELYQRSWDDESLGSLMDLFSCSMAVLHYSWKPEDVGSVPPYLIEAKTVIQPTQQRGVKMGDFKREPEEY